VSSGDYPYPADEFDSAAARVGPQGAHRSPRSRWQRLGPFLLVLVLFPLLAFGAVTWLSNWDGLPGVIAPPVSEDDETMPAATDPAVATEPTETATTPPPVETPTEPPAPVADLARVVEVFNSTNRSGLAASAAERVKEAGFTSVTAENWTGEDPAASVVYYPAAADVATAQAVAAALGITAVEESAADADEGITVVLAADYSA
jgi:hypothetical protein